MQRTVMIFARLFWTLSAMGSLYNFAFAGHPLGAFGWIANCAVLGTAVLCWLSYPWAWMTAGIVGFIVLAYQTYGIAMFLLAFTSGPDDMKFTLSYGPIHIKGFTAKILWWAEPLFGVIVTIMLAYFGACRSDAKEKSDQSPESTPIGTDSPSHSTDN